MPAKKQIFDKKSSTAENRSIKLVPRLSRYKYIYLVVVVRLSNCIMLTCMHLRWVAIQIRVLCRDCILHKSSSLCMHGDSFLFSHSSFFIRPR